LNPAGGGCTAIVHVPDGLKPEPVMVTRVPGRALRGGDPLVGLNESGPGITVNDIGAEAESP